jgi:putative zinc finger/helix-turn-helix YgiT family protein
MLENVEVFVCADCSEEELAIPGINQLERLLVDEICRQQSRLAPTHIRFLRKHLGWSGVDFARHFGVSPETVSRWENGAQAMGTQADRLLRVCATRLNPIEDYAALEELLDRVGGETIEAALNVRRAGQHWERAA